MSLVFLRAIVQTLTQHFSDPLHVFGGGSGDVESAIQCVIDSVRGCTDCQTKVDVVVLRASGADGYNDFIFAMKGVDSVETLLITECKDSEDKSVIVTIKQAEIIFFVGSDQCNYVRYFRDTPIEHAVKDVYKVRLIDDSIRRIYQIENKGSVVCA